MRTSPQVHHVHDAHNTIPPRAGSGCGNELQPGVAAPAAGEACVCMEPELKCGAARGSGGVATTAATLPRGA